MRSSWIIWWVLNPMTIVLKRQKRRHRHRQGHVKMEVEMSDTTTSQGRPGAAGSCKRQEGSSRLSDSL